MLFSELYKIMVNKVMLLDFPWIHPWYVPKMIVAMLKFPKQGCHFTICL